MVAVLREISNLPGAIQVAEQYHDSPEVLLQLALCYLDQETKGLAPASQRGLDVSRKLVASRPNQPIFQVMRAKMSQKMNLDEEALNALEEAIEMWPDEAEWHVWASKLANKLNQGDRVVDHWEKALALVPQRKSYAVPAGKAFLAYHQEQKAIQILEEVLDETSINSEICYLLGSAYYQTGQLKQALVYSERAVALDPFSVNAALLSGEISLAMGHDDDALAWGQKAVSIDDRHSDSILFLAFIFEKRNKLQEALQIVQKALQKNVINQEMLLERARLVYQVNGAAAALPLLKELDTVYPEQVPVLKLLARVEKEGGDLVQSEKIAFQALRLDPDQPELNLLMGKLQRLSGQLDQAIHFLSLAIVQAPGLADAYLELGQVYLDRRETPQALQTYQKGMKAVPHDFRMVYQAGLILREGKDYQRAETMLRMAAELAPDDLNIRRQLGAVITLNLIHSSQEASSSNETQRAQRK
ncbi:MAG: tetratricopeptide repeat protein [Saprospiraceae bacterium]|nr:tetratricopeptide repeat protein [Saprospiraceae bacterium]